MERLSKHSRVIVPRETASHIVPDTIVAFKEINQAKIMPITVLDDNTDEIEFQIQPNVGSEINLYNCFVHVEYKVLTSENGPYSTSKQISCVNALGVLGYESVDLTMNGSALWKSYKHSNFANFIDLMTKFDAIEKKTILYSCGYREDTEGQSGSERIDLDGSDLCDCTRCLCWTHQPPTGGPYVHTSEAYEEILKWKPRTKAEIIALHQESRKLNYGAYLRSLMLARGRSGKGFTLKTRLNLIHPFFRMQTVFPLKRLLTLTFKLNSPSLNLLCLSTDKDYKLAVKKMHLEIEFVKFEQSLRTGWYEAINENSLIRELQLPNERHFTLVNGVSEFFLQAVLTYSTMPNYIIMFFHYDDTHVGNFKNRFSFQCHDVRSIDLKINGVPHHFNDYTANMDISPESTCLYFWYDKFLIAMVEIRHLVFLLKNFIMIFFCTVFHSIRFPQTCKMLMEKKSCLF